ncbi:ComF family protein [Sphaerisporangium perillae]|uniref:ComF family protein n=1 Tax=Sphaerisporangium perillae TaxID=2935860 RepID=UPI00200C87AC|nr:phosphoribosyltransferase family protein [Sphaerisporangium perillae]
MNECAIAAGPVGGGAQSGRVLTALLDLISLRSCVGCARPGAALCTACAAELHGDPGPRPPSPPPRGLPDCWSAARYEGVIRRAILDYKEKGRTVLAPPLAACLASTLLAALHARGVRPGEPFALVPVPSSRRSVRRRGHDPVRRLAALAAGHLRARGWPVTPAPLLAQARRVSDQAGLSAPERAANLGGAFRVRPARRAAERPAQEPWAPVASPATTSVAAPAAALPAAPADAGVAVPVVVLVDDVVTTGTTLAEAARALRREGVAVPLAVTLAATSRRVRHARVRSKF